MRAVSFGPVEYSVDQMLSRLYCGSFEDAAACTHTDVQAVLTLCEQRIVSSIPAGLQMEYMPLPDEVWLPPDVWRSRVQRLDHLLRVCKFSVLVHCRLGVSRAPALCVAYLATTGWDIDDALAYITSKRACVKVHPETLRGVREWWGGTHGH